MKHLELFAGIGGFRRALELIGEDLSIPVESVGYSEIDANACKTYSANFSINSNEVVMGDINAFTSDVDNIKSLPDFDLLTGGFPCQSFSMMGEQKGFDDEARGQMFFRIIDILKIKKPPYVLLENVKNLKTHDHGHSFQVIKSEIENLGYSVYCDVFNTNNFHLAQIRNRIFIFAIKESLSNSVPFDSKSIQGYLDSIIDDTKLENQSSVIDVLQKTVDSKYYLSERIKPTILSDGSGEFRANSEINRMQARPLTASMHKMHRACQDNYYSQDFIDSEGTKNLARCLTKDELSELNIRKLTPEEAMRLQGFPVKWVYNARSLKVADGALYKQAGNAVSVNVVYAIIRYLLDTKLIKI